jgi:hypothetical protein
MSADPQDVFVGAIKRIEAAYSEMGHSHGWRFLCVSRRVLRSDPGIVLLTSNAGGNGIPADHPPASCEDGCAYLSESWGSSKPVESALQVQVQRLFDAVAERLPSKPKGSNLMEDSLIGYFIPFRSPRLAQLHRPKESLRIANGLWTELFRLVRPRLMIALDPAAYSGLKDICAASGGVKTLSEVCGTG